MTPPLLLLWGPGLVLARVRDGVAAASRQRTAECVGVDSGRRAGVSCCLQFEAPCGVSNGRQHGQLHVCCLRGSTSQPGLRPPSLWACAALPRRPQDPAGAQRCPSGFSASPRFPAWCEATAQGARVAPHGGGVPAQTWSWVDTPAGTLSAVLIPCRADGHGKPRVTSSWTVSDLGVGPDGGCSRRSANPRTNRVSAGGPGDL